MPILIRDVSTVPDNGWSYYVSATNYTISTRNYQLIFSMVRQHCEANTVTVPSDQEIIQQMCERLSVPCLEGNEALINRFSQNMPSTLPTSCCSAK